MRWDELTTEQKNTLMAERVMDWHKGKGGAMAGFAGWGYEWPAYWCDAEGQHKEPRITDAFANLYPWSPVTSIAATWQVVRRMKELDPVRFNLSLYEYTYNRTYASFLDNIDNTLSMGTAEGNGEHCTPEAICHAALLALGLDI